MPSSSAAVFFVPASLQPSLGCVRRHATLRLKMINGTPLRPLCAFEIAAPGFLSYSESDSLRAVASSPARRDIGTFFTVVRWRLP